MGGSTVQGWQQGRAWKYTFANGDCYEGEGKDDKKDRRGTVLAAARKVEQESAAAVSVPRHITSMAFAASTVWSPHSVFLMTAGGRLRLGRKVL